MPTRSAPAQPIYLYHRRRRTLVAEQVPGENFLKLTYGSPWGRRAADWIWSRVLFSRIYGWPLHQRLSRWQIKRFIRQQHIDMSEVVIPAEGFRSFNDFFIRQLKPDARPVAEDRRCLIAPADSRLKVMTMNAQTRLDIKGQALTLAQLLNCHPVPADFANGLCLQFRLAPRDYHRFGYIEDGIQGPVHVVKGRLYSVSPLALRHMPAIWGVNLRHWCFLQTRALGTVLHIEVGATMVGSIVQHQPSGGPCRRGQEKGYFQMGGSTVLIILPSGRVNIDADILQHSNRDIETLVRYGESIGRYTSTTGLD